MSTALTTIYEPASMDQALALSEKLSRSALVPAPFRAHPPDLSIMLPTTPHVGLGPMQRLRGLFVINGKVGMAADLMVALCVSKPQCEYFTLTESTQERATYVAKRKGGKEQTLTFTMEQATIAGLLRNPTWKS